MSFDVVISSKYCTLLTGCKVEDSDLFGIHFEATTKLKNFLRLSHLYDFPKKELIYFYPRLKLKKY